MEYLALTDTSTLEGVPEFLEICRENAVKPLIGCEFSVMHYYHDNYSTEEMNPEGADQVVLFARNTVGFRSLIKLQNRADLRMNSESHPYVFLDEIESIKNGLYIMVLTHTGTIGTFLNQGKYHEVKYRIEKYLSIFPKYHAISHCDLLNPIDLVRLNYTLQLSDELEVPLSVVNCVQAIDEYDANEIDKYINSSRRSEKIVYLPQLKGWPERFFKNEKEMKKLFGGFPWLLSETNHIAETIYFDVSKYRLHRYKDPDYEKIHVPLLPETYNKRNIEFFSNGRNTMKKGSSEHQCFTENLPIYR